MEDDDYVWECTGCGDTVNLADNHETPDHGLCWSCSSIAVTDLYARIRALAGNPDLAGILRESFPEAFA